MGVFWKSSKSNSKVEEVQTESRDLQKEVKETFEKAPKRKIELSTSKNLSNRVVSMIGVSDSKNAALELLENINVSEEDKVIIAPDYYDNIKYWCIYRELEANGYKVIIDSKLNRGKEAFTIEFSQSEGNIKKEISPANIQGFMERGIFKKTHEINNFNIQVEPKEVGFDVNQRRVTDNYNKNIAALSTEDESKYLMAASSLVKVDIPNFEVCDQSIYMKMIDSEEVIKLGSVEVVTLPEGDLQEELIRLATEQVQSVEKTSEKAI